MVCIFIIKTGYNHRKVGDITSRKKHKFYFLHHEACKQLNIFTFDILFTLLNGTDKKSRNKTNGTAFE